MFKYKIVDNSNENPFFKEGTATLEQLKNFLPNEIYQCLLTPGTISIKEQSGHESYEIIKL
ncbi:hypothetical protein [Flagellimonas sp.]|jgi:hypothetical protein|uniref:hypothetical protein n=1 Tax=Flagellimonas sp. TaxID=2058762 RepID=UPI003BA85A1D